MNSARNFKQLAKTVDDHGDGDYDPFQVGSEACGRVDLVDRVGQEVPAGSAVEIEENDQEAHGADRRLVAGMADKQPLLARERRSSCSDALSIQTECKRIDVMDEVCLAS